MTSKCKESLATMSVRRQGLVLPRIRSGYSRVLVRACYLSLRRKGHAFPGGVLDMLLGPWQWLDSDSLQSGDRFRWQRKPPDACIMRDFGIWSAILKRRHVIGVHNNF